MFLKIVELLRIEIKKLLQWKLITKPVKLSYCRIEPIRIYGLYEPKRELATTKRGRSAESYAKYIAGLISKSVKLSSEEKETAAQFREK